MAGRVRLKHRIEYTAFRAGSAGGRLLSEPQAVRVGETLGRLGYRLGIKRAVVESNLRIAFPDADDSWIRRTALEAYAPLGRETMMMLRLSWTSPADLIARTRPVNQESAAAAIGSGRGAVFVAGHLGNWEIGAAMMAARGYPVLVIAKRAANPLFYARIMAARNRLGVGVIDFQHATRAALRALREGKAVAFAADQHAGRAGIWVPFFGRPASTYRGPALLALRADVPMYLSIPLRMEDGTYELRLEEIDTRPTGNLERDVARVTREWTRRLEWAVRVNPEQYLWHHRRWRTPPSGAEEQAAGRAV
jgi:Kdo2-lipid IVA lauroyltransferase/acyltransferase